jgi:hypothetical protein
VVVALFKKNEEEKGGKYSVMIKYQKTREKREDVQILLLLLKDLPFSLFPFLSFFLSMREGKRLLYIIDLWS